MFEPLYTAEEMRAVEAGHDVKQLMRRAGGALAEFILEEYDDESSVTVVCGPGNNGGDGQVAARRLRQANWDVRVVESKPEDEEKDLGKPGLIVDAVFGTGFTGEPRPGAARLIDQINSAGVDVVAVDVPSGVDASTGEVAGAVVDATWTVTFHREKVGLYVAPGTLHRGELEVVDIGLQDRETVFARPTTEILDLVPLRSPGDTKYTAGSVLVVGGSPGLTGAACLAARAAFRADAGYVAVAAPRASLPVLEQQLLEAVKRPLEEVWDAVGRARSLALGPGLGRSEGAKELVRRLLEETDLPAVVDADALFDLDPFTRTAPTVLTPHSGELGRLLDVDSSWIDAHRLEASRRAVERFNCVLLLKGEGTIVAAPDEQTLICPGFPSLATAGTGDVLTGIIGSFLAKGLDARLAAAAAVTAHTEAAAEAPQRAGLIASDVIEMLPYVLG
ncbi:MAG: NAD(P)H-hydrate dehydratase [Actinobacteria bacterium]|nr:MAG: NAD(P)H-hydrate dehydratase [Actinomycetota bacterium]